MERRDAVAAGGLTRLAALAAVGAVLGASAIVGRRNAPDPSHPGIRRWYRRLDKPGYTPPDALFGAVWPVLETGLAVGGYRLLRRPAGARETLLSVCGWSIARWWAAGRSSSPRETARCERGRFGRDGRVWRRLCRHGREGRPTRGGGGAAFVAWLGFATLLAERIWRDNPDERR